MAIKRVHRRKGNDALVPINGLRVRTAIEWRGLSVNRAASRIKVSQQTLDSIVRTRTKRCHESLREKLAKLVGLPATWLGGEAQLLPTMTPWLPLPELGYEPPLWVDENLRIVRPPVGGDLTQRSSFSPRYQLVAVDLSNRIAEAWKRDIAEGNEDAKASLAHLATGRWKDRPWDRVVMLVTRFVSAFWWRRLLLRPAPLPGPVDPKTVSDAEWRVLGEKMMLQNQRRAEEELETDTEFATGVAAALGVTLRPWFTGERKLDYGPFIGTLDWASSGFGKNPQTEGI